MKPMPLKVQRDMAEVLRAQGWDVKPPNRYKTRIEEGPMPTPVFDGMMANAIVVLRQDLRTEFAKLKAAIDGVSRRLDAVGVQGGKMYSAEHMARLRVDEERVETVDLGTGAKFALHPRKDSTGYRMLELLREHKKRVLTSTEIAEIAGTRDLPTTRLTELYRANLIDRSAGPPPYYYQINDYGINYLNLKEGTEDE